MSFQILNAVRDQKFPRIAISGPSGAGKTATALLLLRGMGAKYEEIVVIDTEHNSSALYSNSKPFGISEHIGQFKILPFNPPHTLERYIEAIKYCKESGVKYLIIDSLSHSWNGEGGTLDKVADIQRKISNAQAAWKDVNPILTRMINNILDYPGAVVCTMRAKQDYAYETNPITGKKEVKKLGLAPVIREGIEYEFDTVFDMDLSHYGTTNKDRTGLFGSQQLIMDITIGQRFEEWRKNGSIESVDYYVKPSSATPKSEPAVLNANLNANLDSAPSTNTKADAKIEPDKKEESQQTKSEPERSQVMSLREEADRLVALFKKHELDGPKSKDLCMKALGTNIDITFAKLTAAEMNKCYLYAKAELEKPAETPSVPLTGVLF